MLSGTLRASIKETFLAAQIREQGGGGIESCVDGHGL
jgi:hypothetical protein